MGDISKGKTSQKCHVKYLGLLDFELLKMLCQYRLCQKLMKQICRNQNETTGIVEEKIKRILEGEVNFCRRILKKRKKRGHDSGIDVEAQFVEKRIAFYLMQILQCHKILTFYGIQIKAYGAQLGCYDGKKIFELDFFEE